MSRFWVEGGCTGALLSQNAFFFKRRSKKDTEENNIKFKKSNKRMDESVKSHFMKHNVTK